MTPKKFLVENFKFYDMVDSYPHYVPTTELGELCVEVMDAYSITRWGKEYYFQSLGIAEFLRKFYSIEISDTEMFLLCYDLSQTHKCHSWLPFLRLNWLYWG